MPIPPYCICIICACNYATQMFVLLLGFHANVWRIHRFFPNSSGLDIRTIRSSDRSRNTIFYLLVTTIDHPKDSRPSCVCCVGAKQQKTEVDYAQSKRRPLLQYDRIRLQSRCGHAFILNPLLAPDQMSPYVVPDHVLERKLPTSLTPTFWGALTVVSFDSLDTDSPQSSVIPDNHLVAQLSTSSKGSENAITPLSNLVDFPAIPHPCLYFDDGNITFRVRLCAFRSWYLLIW